MRVSESVRVGPTYARLGAPQRPTPGPVQVRSCALGWDSDGLAESRRTELPARDSDADSDGTRIAART